MRVTTAALFLSAAATVVAAQDATIATPTGNFGKYDPTLSAKEAVLANWEMAASGIRAGEVLGGRIALMADEGASFARLSRQAAFAQDTMVARYNAAGWAYAGADLTPVDAATLRAMAAATAATCEGPCEAERAAIGDAFANGAAQMGAAARSARAAIDARRDRVDAALMTEQFMIIADYLESGAWGTDLTLTAYGMDVDVVAHRIVGTMALWGNVEPYVGMANPEIDGAINAASQTLLRTLRRDTRGLQTVEADSHVMQDLRAAAAALGAEFRRAAALFST